MSNSYLTAVAGSMVAVQWETGETALSRYWQNL